jgi:hypothetical protein
MSGSCKLFFAFLSIVLMIGLCASKKHYAFYQTGQPESKLEAANNAIEQVFRAVLDAEQAGANATGLLARLNVTADLLAQADNALRNGNSSISVNTDNVLSIASQVETTAITARNKALEDGANALWSSIVFSAERVIIFGLALFWFGAG